jgi:hypothetical protein
LENKEKVQSFQEKLALWGGRQESGNFENVPLFNEIISESVHPAETNTHENVTMHL